MLLLGIDIGTSSVKVSVVDAETQQCLAAISYPETEREILTRQPGWAEQQPLQWWQDAKQAILLAHATQRYNPQDIGAIGIAYQMHGLVLIDEQHHVLRDAIIWCDSRAVPYGEQAFQAIGPEQCLTHLLNSPGNFTAAKLAWVKEHEPEVYQRIHQVLLPGDFLALQLTGEATTSISALSEGIFWDFAENELSEDVFRFFGFERELIPPVRAVFADHGHLREIVAEELGLRVGIPVTYKAGDQPNNALSLNVLRPGEVAATAGTSGVIYAVTDELFVDAQSRVNAFAHVNHAPELPRLGVLLCINGAGSMNRWVKQTVGHELSYPEVNQRAAGVPAGSEGLLCLPFGNGVERMLANEAVGAHFLNLDLNVHTPAHLLRAVQEGVAFAFRYGLDIMRENGLHPTVVKAGKTNMFLSELFGQVFVNVTGLAVELYQTDGSVGAALGAGIGAGQYASPDDAFRHMQRLQLLEPNAEASAYEQTYQRWKAALLSYLHSTPEPAPSQA
ncbi:FGGY family carbohydrate kinase [Hymenobacter sp. YC55]|uniref:xylulokinase n=1 Tax=Hymenobacter sp. YC55 TaxID=3034019 RepID=UPI0023F6F0A9|nr:FGGY family carbohydrate kinase [Hymenobacter sp. YC55]MDF7815833.1 FGGY family carbohydrate kinase [Hymenobacter sp. YC55]